MKIFITYDANWEARLDKVLDSFDKTGYKLFFEKHNYGKSIEGICVVLMCRDPSLKFKQRIRYIKKEKQLYIDIMLDFLLFIEIERNQREKIVAEKLASEIPPIIAKYKFDDFNFDQFKKDLIKCFKKLSGQ